MAAKEFAAKLGIRAGQHVYLQGAPPEFAARLIPLVVRRELR